MLQWSPLLQRSVLLLQILLSIDAIHSVFAATASGDVQALLSLRNGFTNGREFLGDWYDPDKPDPCVHEWQGVLCSCPASANSTTSFVTFLALANPPATPGLKGTISPAIGNLTELRGFSLDGNYLNGTIPSEVANLQKLESLWVASNSLSGELPAWLTSLPNLRNAVLSGNNFQGGIPPEWCRNISLPEPSISLSGNEGLCGAVPPCVEDSLVGLETTSLFSVDDLPEWNFQNTEELETRSQECCQSSDVSFCVDDDCWITLPPLCTNNVSFTCYGLDDSGNISYTLSFTPAGVDTDCSKEYVVPFNVSDATTVTDPPQTMGFQTYNEYFAYQLQLNGSLCEGRPYYIALLAESTLCPNQRSTLFSSDTCTAANHSVPEHSVIPDLTLDPVGNSVNITVKMATPFLNCGRSPCTYYWQLCDVTQGGPIEDCVVVEPPGQPFGQGLSLGFFRDWGGVIYATTNRLTPGHFYQAVIFATTATATGHAESDPVKMDNAGDDRSRHVVALSVAIGLAAGVAALLLFALVYLRIRWMMWLRKMDMRHRHMQYFKDMLDSTMQASDCAGFNGWSAQSSRRQRQRQRWLIGSLREVALVITDLQDSTLMSNRDESAYRQIQDVHDTVIREQIDSCGGYEINTEGDSFNIAFPSVAAAVRFCMNVQYKLMDTEWPRRVLRLASASRVKQNGVLVFCGPRVRMGINWAPEGTVGVREHKLTKTWVFSGPGFNLAHELGDAAHGGQVLMTHSAWEQVSAHMGDAGFPTVRQLGLFKLESWDKPLWIYEIQQQLGRPLQRRFPPPRSIKLLQEGHGYHIVPACTPINAKEELSFVAVAVDFAWVNSRPAWLHSRIGTILLVIALQYQGYMFSSSAELCSYLIAFLDSDAALFFCHAAQLALLYEDWPQSWAKELGPKEVGWWGRLLFYGPRCTMAVHSTTEIKLLSAEAASGGFGSGHCEECYAGNMVYIGTGLEFLREVAQSAHGGQVVLTESAWKSVHDRLPCSCTFYHLGTHMLSDRFPETQMLMEVMPTLLARRTFPPLASKLMVTPGYRESPDPGNNMAIVFAIACKPAQRVHENNTYENNRAGHAAAAVLAAYHSALQMYEELLQRLLLQYNGYQCKEPEPGKFTLAFGSLSDALCCMTALQTGLLDLPWPEGITAWSSSKDSPADDQLWRGLRVKAGCAYGRPDHRKPLNTGHADYYGSLPNLAARVCSLAQPGQVLVEASGLDMFQVYSKNPIDGEQSTSSTSLPEAEATRCINSPDRPDVVLIRPLGPFKLKGFDAERLVYDVSAQQLQDRFCAISTGLQARRTTNGLVESFTAQVMRPLRQALQAPMDSFTTVTRSVTSVTGTAGLRTKSGIGRVLNRGYPSHQHHTFGRARSRTPPMHLHSYPEGAFPTDDELLNATSSEADYPRSFTGSSKKDSIGDSTSTQGGRSRLSLHSGSRLSLVRHNSLDSIAFPEASVNTWPEDGLPSTLQSDSMPFAANATDRQGSVSLGISRMMDAQLGASRQQAAVNGTNLHPSCEDAIRQSLWRTSSAPQLSTLPGTDDPYPHTPPRAIVARSQPIPVVQPQLESSPAPRRAVRFANGTRLSEEEKENSRPKQEREGGGNGRSGREQSIALVPQREKSVPSMLLSSFKEEAEPTSSHEPAAKQLNSRRELPLARFPSVNISRQDSPQASTPTKQSKLEQIRHSFRKLLWNGGRSRTDDTQKSRPNVQRVTVALPESGPSAWESHPYVSAASAAHRSNGAQTGVTRQGSLAKDERFSLVAFMRYLSKSSSAFAALPPSLYAVEDSDIQLP